MDPRIVYLSSYPPRRCGIATFTRDLRSAVDLDGRVVALAPLDPAPREPAPRDPSPFDPPEVMAFLESHSPADYRRAAIAVDGSGAEVVSLQHEYGLFGGRDGINVLDFAERLETPLVTTLHTVLSRPSEGQRRIVHELGARSAATVVMSQTAARILAAAYDVPPGRIKVIPHGVPDLPPPDPTSGKATVGLGGRPLILSFGLLGPGKGYETAIEAMAEVRRAVPDAIYVILGATHPDLLRREGDRYRDDLRSRAETLGVIDQVRFEDRFVSRLELGRWLRASDVFVTPYPNLDQLVSGTLSYALGAGLAIVSTPYLYAREMLAGDRGILVTPGASDELGAALVGLLTDPDRRAELGRRAYALGRGMTWTSAGAAYRSLFESVARPVTTSRTDRRPAVEPIHA